MSENDEHESIKVIVDETVTSPESDKHDHNNCDHDHGHGHKHDHDSCGHGHDHKHGHDSCGHDHGHDHPPKDDRIGHRDAESGGSACQFALDFVLPGETDEAGIFEKLENLLESKKGVGDVHIRRDSERLELCIHYDRDNTNIETIIALAKTIAAEVQKQYKRRTWFIRGMDSPQCAHTVEVSIGRLPGILQADVAYASERLIVEFESKAIKTKVIEKVVTDLGYELEEPEKGHVCTFHSHDGIGPKLEIPLVVASGILLTLGLLANQILPPSPTGMSPENIATGCYILAFLSAGLLPIRGTVNSLKQRLVDIETLMVVAAVGAAFLGAWFEGAFLLFLFSLGHGLEHRMMDKARMALDGLSKLRPETARKKVDSDIIEVPVADVKRGDLIVIRPGDRVPLDGKIASGETALDESTITGESVPRAKSIGEDVFAGTSNIDGSIEVTVSKLSSESVLTRIIDMVAEAEAQKSPSQKFAQRVEKTFVPVVLAGAPLFSIVLAMTGTDLKEAVLRGISVLVAASPCALALATPATVLAAVTRAARGGVLIKGGAYLEAIGKVSAIAFDKTGTLTTGKPIVKTIAPVEGISTDALLEVAAAGEGHSTHPIALAVIKEAENRKINFAIANQSQAIHGQGVKSTLAGGDIVEIGNLKLFDGLEIPDSIRESAAALERDGQTTLIVRHQEKFTGVIGVADQLREEARETVKRLKSIGIQTTIMLSGDNSVVATAIGADAGVDQVQAPLMPHEKVERVKALAKSHAVAMVGDGVNDAPALAAASVGIAVGGTASEVAMETADLVLMNKGLKQLPFAVSLARTASETIKQNMTIALGVSGVLVLASILKWVEITNAVILHEGSTIVVLLNGLKLLRFKDE